MTPDFSPQQFLKVLAAYSDIRQARIKCWDTSVNQVFGQLHEIKTRSLERMNSNIPHVISQFQVKRKEAHEMTRLTSHELNVFRNMPPNEPTHSYLISQLLDPKGSHGQGELFLSIFLDMLNIQHPNCLTWKVTAEKGKIDILLKSENPHCVVVIENKSNFAVDQENQLYRYWYKEIFLPIYRKRGLHEALDWHSHFHHAYKLIYLTPADWKRPNDNSRERPAGPNFFSELPDQIQKLLPEAIEMRFIEVWTFREKVLEWLNKSYNLIPPFNFRLKEYILQYIEYWT